eukprot:8795450-Ditylum_brightwellii.AAC.1
MTTTIVMTSIINIITAMSVIMMMMMMLFFFHYHYYYNDNNKGYRYLGVMEGVDFHMKEVKEMTEKEYISRVCKILKADM